jgi:hypothetical protein
MANRGRARISINRIAALGAIASLLSLANPASAADVKTSGKLNVPDRSRLFAVCTDPTVQDTLNQDFKGAHRGPSDGDGPPVTITVTLTDRFLKPGVMLRDLGPGDPWTIANLLRATGTEPPPLGDTGDAAPDPYSLSAERSVMRPEDPMADYRAYQDMRANAMHPEAPKFGPNGKASDDQLYDRVLVANASASGSSGTMMAVCVSHPGEDSSAAKELIAEEIANEILH